MCKTPEKSSTSGCISCGNRKKRGSKTLRFIGTSDVQTPLKTLCAPKIHERIMFRVNFGIMKQQKEEDMGHNLGGEGNKTFRMNARIMCDRGSNFSISTHFQCTLSFILHVFICSFLFKYIVFRFFSL